MIKSLIKNILSSALIFAVLTGVILLFDKEYTINWLSLTASTISAAYILSMRNPLNYLAFALGIISSVMLVFLLWRVNLDGAITYLCVFIPAQSYSIYVWRKRAIEAQKTQIQIFITPRWQTTREHWLTLGVAIVLMGLSALLSHHINPTFGLISLLFNALFTTSAILANVLLIYKLIDSRIYWLIFSFAGAGLSLSLGNGGVYLVCMFLCFAVINSVILVSWIKASKQ